jgi:uncharacterized integral membrane protein
MGGNEPEGEARAEPAGGSGATSEPSSAPAPEPDQSLAEVARARRRRAAKAIGALVVFVVLVLFIVANSQPVEVNFLFFTAHPRLIWVMVTCAVLGGLLGYLLGRPGHEGKAKKKRKGGSAPGRS